jgi:5S rRNA maturation endonuclease (ribonuclease M5)
MAVTDFAIRDRSGALVAVHRRIDSDDGKTFAWHRPSGGSGLNGTPVVDLPLFGIHHAHEWSESATIALVEGEKATLALIERGVPAVGTVCGAATTPSAKVLTDLAGRHVAIWADNDDAGREHMKRIAAALHGVAATVRIASWPDAPAKGDAADYCSAGFDPWDILDAAALVTPPSPKRPKSTERPWPEPLATEALHGMAGDFVRAVEPNSEAHPAALLVSFLVAVGVLVGTAVHAIAGDADHPARMFAIIVGDTSKGRKGTSEAPVRRLLQRVDPTLQVAAGLSSGEGLIYRVRDMVERLETVGKGQDRHQELVVVDEGVTDKRLLVVETEFAATLRVLQRDGNSLSPVSRLAWDSGDLSTLTRNNPLHATGAHIGIVGHVTGRELIRYLDRTELASGFVNRFLIIAARRARLLPDGEQVPPELLDPIVKQLRDVVAWAAMPRILRRDDAAGAVWREVYEDLSAGGPGLLGSATNRAEAQVLRLSVLYAILDRSETITANHLFAALAFWRYAEQSAAWVFGDAVGDEVADAIMEATRAKGELSRTDIRDLFARHVNRARIEQALIFLVNAGRLERSDEPTGGRPREVYRVPG